jgi:hypothetical protein
MNYKSVCIYNNLYLISVIYTSLLNAIKEMYVKFNLLVTPPAQRVQFILGEDVGDDAHESHPLFSEMEELVKDGDEMEWKETARQ